MILLIRLSRFNQSLAVLERFLQNGENERIGHPAYFAPAAGQTINRDFVMGLYGRLFKALRRKALLLTSWKHQ